MMVIEDKRDGVAWVSNEVGAVMRKTGLSERTVKGAKLIGYEDSRYKIIVAEKLPTKRGGSRKVLREDEIVKFKGGYNG